MATFTYEDISIEVDEDGFMQEPEVWDESIAAALGTTEGGKVRRRADDPQALQTDRISAQGDL
jgi:sulfur relay (sulfurtransferase) DsrC/TusE family protein